MPLYEYPTNISNLTDLVTYTSNATQGWFGSLIAFAIFCVTFFSLKQYQTSRAFAGASFITLITIIIFRIINLVGDLILITAIMLVIIAVIWLIVGDSKDY